METRWSATAEVLRKGLTGYRFESVTMNTITARLLVQLAKAFRTSSSSSTKADRFLWLFAGR